MNWLQRLGILIAVMGVVSVAWVEAPSAQDRAPERRVRELSILSGRGAELGVRVSDAAGGGVRVEEVQPDSPADKAGLKRDDVVTEFDGERVRSGRQFARLIQETPVGRTVKAVVMRGGQKKELQMTPGEPRAMADVTLDTARPRDWFGDFSGLGDLRDYLRSFNFNLDAGAISGGRLGVTVDELTTQLAEYFGAKEGVLVASVADGSAAARAGLKAGDVVTSVNGRRVATREDLAREVRESTEEIRLGIVRDKKETTMTVKLESRRPSRGRPV